MLATEQPIHAVGRRPVLLGHQCIDRQRRIPCRQVRVNRPTAVRPHGLLQKRDRLLAYRMIRSTRGRQTHQYKTRERHSLQIATTSRLHPLQHSQALCHSRPANQAAQRIPRRAVKIARLTNRYERGNCITDHGQAEKPVEPLRQAGQLEGERRDFTPIDQPRQRRIRQDRHGKRLVLAIAAPQGRDAPLSLQVLFGPLKLASPPSDHPPKWNAARTSIVVATFE